MSGLVSARVGFAVLAHVVVAVAMFIPMPSSGGSPSIPHLDKLVHVACWALIAFATWWVWSGSRARRFAFTVGLGALFGVAVELVQGLTPHRGADVWDALADILGASLGAAMAALVERASLNKGAPT